MGQRILIGILTLLLVLIGVSKLRSRPKTPPTVVSVAIDSTGAAASHVSTRQPLGLLPGVNAAPAGASTIDLMARLAIRRRLEREGNRVYLDSLLAATDSILTRWNDRPDRTMTVFFAADTAIPGFTAGALDDARAGLGTWSGNDAAVAIIETRDSAAADIRVEWAPTLQDSSQLGLTKVSWNANGVIERALITLSIGQRPALAELPPAMRRRVAAHEFGHALGLPHSGSEDDLMFATSPVNGPSRRDLATLLLLYAVPPGPLRVQ